MHRDLALGLLVALGACSAPLPGKAGADAATDPGADAGDRPGEVDAGDEPEPVELLVDSYIAKERAVEILEGCPAAASYRIPVLSLTYAPSAGDNLDPAVTGLSTPIAELRDKVARLDAELAQALELGSTYRPTRDPDAGCSLDYEVIERLHYDEAFATGERLPSGEHHPDYRGVLEREEICKWVDDAGVREVWLYGYHTGSIAPAESNMAGPYGDVSNSYRFDDMPVCGHSYTLYNYNYGRGLGEALENHGHQIEAMMDHLDVQLFRDRFVGPYGEAGATNGCGNVHIPPNAEADYSWYETDPVTTDCGDWKPDRSGATTVVDCTTWGCDHDAGTGFKIWWMSHIPGRDNGLSWNGRPMRNWWDVVGDYDAVKAQGTGLNAP